MVYGMACIAWIVLGCGIFTLVACLNTPCGGCADRPPGSGCVWKDEVWIMGTLCGDYTGRPPGTYCGKICHVEAMCWMRLEIWEGTPCGDCAGRPLGTPRVVCVV